MTAHSRPAGRLLLIALFLFGLLCAGQQLSAYTTDSAIYNPPNYLTFLPPAVGGSYTDPIFLTAIKRISDTTTVPRIDSTGMVPNIQTEYSTMSPFNMDNTRLILVHL